MAEDRHDLRKHENKVRMVTKKVKLPTNWQMETGKVVEKVKDNNAQPVGKRLNCHMQQKGLETKSRGTK